MQTSETPMGESEKREVLAYLVDYLLDESGACIPTRAIGRIGALAGDRHAIGALAVDELWDAFRALVNTRPPMSASPEFLEAQDRLLRSLIAEAGVATVEDALVAPLDERLRLWRGDITTLRVDGIVNAANSQLLGCWVPGHYCIDNAIHTYAGIQLRAECDRIMQAQGRPEPTGQAKVTSAWNLPCEHVIHTVGPIADGHPTDEHRELLASCYRAVLDAALQHGMRSVAFCCISTGVFGFPQEEAAGIAVRAVREWLDAHDGAGITVVFNVFGARDEQIYQNLLGL